MRKENQKKSDRPKGKKTEEIAVKREVEKKLKEQQEIEEKKRLAEEQLKQKQERK